MCVREGFMVAAGIYNGDKATSLTRKRHFNKIRFFRISEFTLKVKNWICGRSSFNKI